jgi:hypothetical protein
MFPTTFIKRLAAAHVGEAAVLVALVLCDMARRNERFPVTGAVMCKAGQSRQHKRRVLERLERVGMIAVEWRGRKSPMVTPLVRAGKR